MGIEPGILMDGLLVKLILQEASEDEKLQVDQWLAESDENARYFSHFKLIWNESKKLEAQSTVDEELAWQRFRTRTKAQVEEPKVVEFRPAWWQSTVGIAAMVICAIGVVWLVYLNMNSAPDVEQRLVRADNQTVSDTLPDGSVVVLNKHSSISYNDPFTNGDERHITLSGEAFFTVTPDKEKPFVISVNDVTVKVVGTSFNIKDNKTETEVVVETGVVEVSKEKKSVRLKPQQKVRIVPQSADLQPELVNNEFYSYYRTGKLICMDTPLPELVAALREYYHADIVIENGELNRKRINTTFDHQTLPQILGVIGETFDITIQHKGEQIILK